MYIPAHIMHTYLYAYKLHTHIHTYMHTRFIIKHLSVNIDFYSSIYMNNDSPSWMCLIVADRDDSWSALDQKYPYWDDIQQLWGPPKYVTTHSFIGFRQRSPFSNHYLRSSILRQTIAINLWIFVLGSFSIQ